MNTRVSAPDKDQVCYIMMSKLSESSKNILLELYNRVWESGKLPSKWKEAIIVPILKAGKDGNSPSD